jgi:ABC-type multidrug transport system fused ATPase/permease subunit
VIKLIKTSFKYCLLSLLLLFVSGRIAAQTVKVEANLKDFTIKIGDQTKLFLVVSQPANERVNFPALTDTVTGKVQIVSTNKADTVIDQNDKNRITVTQSYVITSFEPGTHSFPAFEFGTAAGVVKSNELTLQVETVKVDTAKAIFDIKQPLLVTYTFIDWLKDNWVLVVAGLVIIGLIIGIIYYLRKRPKDQPVVKIAKPAIPAHVTATNKLNELRAKKLWQQDEFKQYYSELTDIIREYLEQRYNIKTYEKTTDEILASLNNRQIVGEYRELLKKLLTLADLVKFAKVKPVPQENEESIDNAIAFVLKTKSDGTNTVGGSSNEPV